LYDQTMTKAKTPNKPRHKPLLVFKNVAVLAEDHALLREIADRERRSMAQQLTVLIRQAGGVFPQPQAREHVVGLPIIDIDSDDGVRGPAQAFKNDGTPI